MNAETIITPIIHHNGDSQDTLLDNLQQAYRAVRLAMEAMNQNTPNARNYYVEPGRLQKAQAQHAERMAHLKAVYNSLQAEAIQLQDETCL